MDVIIRKPRWDNVDALISNYYSLLDEAKEDPLFGITQPHQGPDLTSEHRWFSDLYAAVLRWDAVASWLRPTAGSWACTLSRATGARA